MADGRDRLVGVALGMPSAFDDFQTPRSTDKARQEIVNEEC